jgi:hypothetical protein
MRSNNDCHSRSDGASFNSSEYPQSPIVSDDFSPPLRDDEIIGADDAAFEQTAPDLPTNADSFVADGANAAIQDEGEADASDEPGLPPEELIVPRFPSIKGNPARKLNKLTMATGRIMKAIQVKLLMSKAEMMAVGQCDDKRVSEIASGLIWANIITKEGKQYRYRGAGTNQPLELDELAGLHRSLLEEREKKSQELDRLKAMVARMRPRASGDDRD